MTTPRRAARSTCRPEADNDDEDLTQTHTYESGAP
jgi:hypothetical protein